eukprot:9979014-Alexandrium_andersonii.AAC.1
MLAPRVTCANVLHCRGVHSAGMGGVRGRPGVVSRVVFESGGRNRVVGHMPGAGASESLGAVAGAVHGTAQGVSGVARFRSPQSVSVA